MLLWKLICIILVLDLAGFDMNTLSTISGGLTAYLLSTVLPALLTLLGLIVAMVFAVYGTLHLIAHLKGQTSASVFYKLGRIFGEEIYAEEYSKYRKKRESRDRKDSFRDRYFDEEYSAGNAKEGRDFY